MSSMPIAHAQPQAARVITLGSAMTCLAIVAGCATPAATSDFAGILVPASARWRNAAGLDATADPVVSLASDDVQWWRRFDDPALLNLIETAWARNADVRIALERVAAARAGEVAGSSRLWPALSLGFSGSETTTGVPQQIKQAGLPDTRAIRGVLDVAWEVDLFGAVRAASRALAHDAAATEQASRATRLLVASEVARHYLAWQAAQLKSRQLDALVVLQTEQLRLRRLRWKEGVASDLDISRAQADLSDLHAQAGQVRPLIEAAASRLATLLHLSPGSDLALPDSTRMTSVLKAPAIGPGQPIDLLLRRPDVRAAEQMLLSEGERLAEARANLWPRVLFSAGIGRQDLKLNALDLAPSLYRNLATSFVMPLFNAGRLDAIRDAQAHRQSSARLAYEKAALTAVEEVEVALAQSSEAQARVVAHRTTREQRERQVRWAESLLREGEFDRIQRLDADRALAFAWLTEVESGAAAALAQIQLYKALGGAWSSKE